MKLVKKEKQQVIQSETCGLLTEVLNNKNIPFSIVLSEDIKPTVSHHHKKAREIYWILVGELQIKVSDKIITLKQGDLLIIEPQESHQVISASEKNKVVVLCSPPWEKEDEVID